MGGTIKSISDPGLSLSILSPGDVGRIHNATLEVIEKTGVRFPSSKALDIWEAHGAQVDRSEMVVRAPGHLIEGALNQAPPAYTLAARDWARGEARRILENHQPQPLADNLVTELKQIIDAVE